jgi:uncharacterized protein YcgI (DUF1989 family)
MQVLSSPNFDSVPLAPSQSWLASIPAGMKLGFEARGPGVGAAFFAWAQRDPFEQLSDAYTFMELRWARPRVGDSLYSTLRRPIVTIQRDDARQSVDLLRHDVWWSREQYVCLLSKEAAARSFPAPDLRDWPFAVNLFARTLVGTDGMLMTDVSAAVDGARIELITGFEVVVGVIAAGSRSPAIEVTVGL